MPEDLGALLLRVGIISHDQLTQALVDGPMTDGRLAARLVDLGLSEEQLFAYYLSRGFRAIKMHEQLQNVSMRSLKRITIEMVQAFLVLPVNIEDELYLAMVAPSDENALEEIRRVIDEPIIPILTRVRALQSRIRKLNATARTALSPFLQAHDATPMKREAVVPLTRRKPVSPNSEKRIKTIPYIPEHHQPQKNPEFSPSRRLARTHFELPKTDMKSTWDFIPKPSKRTSGSENAVSPFVHAIYTSKNRDEIVQLACEGVRTLARSVVFLTVRDNILRGWMGMGAGVTPHAISNLWIPVASSSIFKRVVLQGTPHYGSYGTTAADHLFRAAIGGRSRTIALQPISVHHRVVAVLCADDLPPLQKDEFETLATSVGEAFRRLLHTES